MPSIDVDVNVNTNNADSLQEMRDALEEVKASATDVSSSLDEVSGESISEVASASDEASSSADNLSSSLDSVSGESISNTGTETDNLTNSLGEASQNAEELNNSLGIIEGSMILSAGEQVKNMSVGLESMAQQMDTSAISVGQLATQTGMAENEMIGLINNISNVTFPNDEAMMYVKSLDQIGVSSNNLGKSATDLDKINDAFGMGAGRVNSLGQELSVLGVDMNNVSSSFNALAYANANTVGGMDNYYTFLKRYDAQFSELGYNVDQASIIIAGATQKYGGGRAALTGLSDALKEADGDSRKLEEALGLQAGSLDNASQITGEYEGQLQQLADEEMEHKTILERIGAVWEDVSLSMSPVLAPLGSAVGLLGQVGSVGMSLTGLRSIAQGFREVTTAVNILREAESLSAGVKAVLTMAFGAETVAEEANAGAKSSAILPTTLLAIAENSLLLPLLLLVGAIIAVVAVLWYLYNNNEMVRQGIDSFMATLRMVIDTIINGVISVINQVIQRIQLIINIIQMLIGGQITLQQAVGMIWSIIISTINGATMAIVNALIGFGQQLYQAVLSAFQRGLTAIISRVAGWRNSAVRGARNVVNGVANTLANLPSRISSAMSGVVNAITKPFTDAYNAVAREVEKIKNKAQEVANNPLSIFEGVDYEGFDDNEGFGGFTGNTLNSSLSTGNGGRSSKVTNNFNINGIIEESASEYIVNSVNGYMKKQNLMRGL